MDGWMAGCTCKQRLGHSEKCLLFTGGFGKKWPAMNKGVSNEDWIWYVAEKNARGKK